MTEASSAHWLRNRFEHHSLEWVTTSRAICGRHIYLYLAHDHGVESTGNVLLATLNWHISNSFQICHICTLCLHPRHVSRIVCMWFTPVVQSRSLPALQTGGRCSLRTLWHRKISPSSLIFQHRMVTECKAENLPCFPGSMSCQVQPRLEKIDTAKVDRRRRKIHEFRLSAFHIYLQLSGTFANVFFW